MPVLQYFHHDISKRENKWRYRGLVHGVCWGGLCQWCCCLQVSPPSKTVSVLRRQWWWTNLCFLFQVPHKGRVEELTEFVVLLLQSGQFLFSLQQSVLKLEDNRVMTRRTRLHQTVWNPPECDRRKDFCFYSEIQKNWLHLLFTHVRKVFVLVFF